jgi:translation elongation factor EF-4
MIKGFEDVKPMVFAGIYPVDTDEYEELRTAMESFSLMMPLTFQPESLQHLVWFSLWIPRNDMEVSERLGSST